MARLDPLVTVITPTFNRARYLADAVESILAQTYPNFELLVVDDGSTDGTGELMRRYTADERVRYLYQENQGQSAARRRALSMARGDYVGFLDSDNVAVPDRLEFCIRRLEENHAYAVVYGDVIKIDEAGNEISRKNMKRYSGRITPYLLQDNCVSMNTALARRSCFTDPGLFSHARRVADDYEMWLRIAARNQFLYVNRYLARYRVMGDQISSDKDARFDANEAIIRDFLRDYRDCVSPLEARAGWSMFMARKGDYLASRGRRREAMRCYLRSLYYRPSARRPWHSLGRLALGRHQAYEGQ